MAKHGWKNKIHISILMVNNPGPAETQICPAFANSVDPDQLASEEAN